MLTKSAGPHIGINLFFSFSETVRLGLTGARSSISVLFWYIGSPFIYHRMQGFSAQNAANTLKADGSHRFAEFRPSSHAQLLSSVIARMNDKTIYIGNIQLNTCLCSQYRLGSLLCRLLDRHPSPWPWNPLIHSDQPSNCGFTRCPRATGPAKFIWTCRRLLIFGTSFDV